MTWLTWKESAERLQDIIINDRWYIKWIRDMDNLLPRVNDSGLKTPKDRSL
jgi:hypothetical protein